MAKHWTCDGFDIVRVNKSPTFEDRTRLGTKEQILHTTRTSTPADGFLDKLGAVIFQDACRANEPQCKVNHMGRNRNAANELLQAHDLFASENLSNVDFDIRRCRFGNPEPVSYTHLTLPTTPYV